MPYADRAAQKAYQRTWIARRRALFFKDKACEWCGSTTELQLHHRDTSRKENHKIWSWGEPRRLAEIAKCYILCRLCHQKAHAQARRVQAELASPCGTARSYWRGCRCDACRTGVREHVQRREGRAA